MWRDLRAGRTGWPVLTAISIAAAAALVATMLILFGIVEANGGRVRDATFALGFSICGAIWCGALGWLWTRRPYGRRWVRAVVAVVGVWVVIIPLMAFMDMAFRRADLLMVGCVFLGICATTLIAAHTAHGRGGAPMRDRLGAIRVTCPSCGYSLVGLETCQCPECGAAFTIDQIIRDQDYAVLRGPALDERAVQMQPAVPESSRELPAPTER